MEISNIPAYCFLISVEATTQIALIKTEGLVFRYFVCDTPDWMSVLTSRTSSHERQRNIPCLLCGENALENLVKILYLYSVLLILTD